MKSGLTTSPNVPVVSQQNHISSVKFPANGDNRQRSRLDFLSETLSKRQQIEKLKVTVDWICWYTESFVKALNRNQASRYLKSTCQSNKVRRNSSKKCCLTSGEHGQINMVHEVCTCSAAENPNQIEESEFGREVISIKFIVKSAWGEVMRFKIANWGPETCQSHRKINGWGEKIPSNYLAEDESAGIYWIQAGCILVISMCSGPATNLKVGVLIFISLSSTPFSP